MFKDDELPNAAASIEGRYNPSVILSFYEEPLAANTMRVLLILEAMSSKVQRGAPLDLVVVLDVSGSMGGGCKLHEIKAAMDFVIKKLSPRDRLSVVTFSNAAMRQCPLRAMSETGKSYLKRIVDGLAVAAHEDEGTNIKSGLEIGVQVLEGRQYTASRTANILLLSAGKQTSGDARQVGNPRNFPVFTVALGAGADMKLLQELAANGGTFSLVRGGIDVLHVLSQLLACFLSVVLLDLRLTLSKPSILGHDLDRIISVDPGDYTQETDSQSGTVTVKFGDLFMDEERHVVVDLSLVDRVTAKARPSFVLNAKLTYHDGQEIKIKDQLFRVIRTPTGAIKPWNDDDDDAVKGELGRRNYADSIRKARALADEKKLHDARGILESAQEALPWRMKDEFRTELQLLLDLMKSQELYEAEGRPCALASETYHARQRFAAWGVEEKDRYFGRGHIRSNYLEQAEKFAKNPDAPLPTADDDKKFIPREEITVTARPPGGFYNLSVIYRGPEPSQESKACRCCCL